MLIVAVDQGDGSFAAESARTRQSCDPLLRSFVGTYRLLTVETPLSHEPAGVSTCTSYRVAPLTRAHDNVGVLVDTSPVGAKLPGAEGAAAPAGTGCISAAITQPTTTIQYERRALVCEDTVPPCDRQSNDLTLWSGASPMLGIGRN